MSQTIRHRRGRLEDVRLVSSIEEGEILSATGSLTLCQDDGITGSPQLFVEIPFIGVDNGSTLEYVPMVQTIAGPGQPSITTQTYGTVLDGLVWLDTTTGKQYYLNAEAVAIDADTGCYTGSHVQISGSAEGVGEIGEAEDGTYTDGLFTDFVPTTPTGTAVDRFNEVLKALSPAPAPDLDDIDIDSNGESGDLSFGASNTIAGYENVDGTGSLPAVDANASFLDVGDRGGIFGSFATIQGTLNEDIPADNPNYPANSFGNADQGTLRLIVNDVEVHTIDLASTAAGINSSNANGSGFSVSATKDAEFNDGSTLDLFKSRTGTYSVGSADQRQGYNYARVIHDLGSQQFETNFVDWVVDDFSTNSAITSQGTGSWNFAPGTTTQISGVNYFANGFEGSTEIPYEVVVTNAYRNVYPSTGGITFGNTLRVGNKDFRLAGAGITTAVLSDGSGNATLSYPNLNTGVANPETTDISLSASVSPSISNNSFHQPAAWPSTYGSSAQNIRFNFSLETLLRNTVNAANVTEDDYLVNSLNSNSNIYEFEDFKEEEYRLQTASIASGIDTASSAWDSSESLVGGSPGHAFGLCQYNTDLVYPTQAGNSGVFTAAKGPAGQPNYSLATGDREYIRYFEVQSGNSTGGVGNKEWALELVGNARVVKEGSNLFASGTEYIKVFAARNTGKGGVLEETWVDLIDASVRVGTGFNSPNTQYIPVASTVNYSASTIAGITVPQGVVKFQDATSNVDALGDIIAIKIVVPQGWTGNLDAIALRYGASTSSTTSLLGNTYSNL